MSEKRIKRNRRIVVRLTLMAAVTAVIPLLAFEEQGRRAVARELTEIREIQARENEIALRAAHSAALDRLQDIVDFHTERAVIGLEELALDRALFAPGSAPVKALDLYRDRHPELLGVKAFGPEGSSLAVSVRPDTPRELLETFRGLPPPPEEARGTIYFGAPVAAPGTRVYYLPVSVPLGRNQAGWVMGALDMRPLLVECREIRFGGSGKAWAVDQTDQVALHWEVQRAFDRRDVGQNDLVRAARADWKGELMAFPFVSRDEKLSMVGRYRVLEQPPWILMTAMPEEDMEFPLKRTDQRMRALSSSLARSVRWAALIVLIWLLAFALHLNRTLARPLSWLARGLETCATGDFDVYIPSTQKDEVGRCVEAFDRMCAATRKVLVPPHEREEPPPEEGP